MISVCQNTPMGMLLDIIIDFFVDAVLPDTFESFSRAKPATGATKIAAFDAGEGSLITGQVVEVRLKGHGKTKALVIDPDAVFVVALTDRPSPGFIELSSLATIAGRLYAIPSVVYKATEAMCKPIRGQKRPTKEDFDRVAAFIR